MTLPKLKINERGSPLLESYLKKLRKLKFQGIISTDLATRQVMATDNSIYQLIPDAVVYPRSTADLQLIMSLAAKDKFRQLSFTPRSGGTSTNGQCLNNEVVIDVSRFLNQIIELNLQEKWVIVEPGVILDQLNHHLQPHGYFFAPTLSTSDRATIGGMVNTDASGHGSWRYGKTSDHLLATEIVLTDGSLHELSPLSFGELSGYLTGETRLSQLYSQLQQIMISNHQVIEERFPRLKRNLTGYNLRGVTSNPGENFNLNYLIAGSEGTLALTARIKLRITAIPKYRQLLLVKYRNFISALQSGPMILGYNPLGIETIDHNVLSQARHDEIWQTTRHLLNEAHVGEIGAINIVEFAGDDYSELEKACARLKERLTTEEREKFAVIAVDIIRLPQDVNAIWQLRKKGVGLLGSKAGMKKPVAFVEDTCVAPENLAEYIEDFQNLLERHNVEYGMFGHIDVGCLHVRPVLDLREASDKILLRQISDEVKTLVLKYNGIFWGEHGKGFRSEYVEEFFGPHLFLIFRQVKTLFDPYNQLNPGKIVTPLTEKNSRVPRLDEITLKGHFDSEVNADFSHYFSSSFACNGNAACFTWKPDAIMCPNYQIGRDRTQSPKGRAMLIREWARLISLNGGDLDSVANQKWIKRTYDPEDFSCQVYSAFLSCLGCKACASACPSHIDIPELKSRFLAIYHASYRRPISDYFIAHADQIINIMARTPKLMNFLITLPIIKPLSYLITGLHGLPLLSTPQPKRIWPAPFKAKSLTQGSPATGEATPTKIVLLEDVMTSFYDWPLMARIIELLGQFGACVTMVPLMENGKGKHVKGFRAAFVKSAQQTTDRLTRLSEQGYTLIGVDPAITLTYRDEYPKLFSWNKAPFTVELLSEWLLPNLGRICKEKKNTKRVRYQMLCHCTEESTAGLAVSAWQAIFKSFNSDLEIVRASCCGMAGAFGLEHRNYKESRRLFMRNWLPKLTAAQNQNLEVVITGSSCRHQVLRFTGMRLRHPAEVILEWLNESSQV